MKHLSTISRMPVPAAQQTSDLSFLLSILGLISDLSTLFLGSFSTIFSGLLSALTTFNSAKNTGT